MMWNIVYAVLFLANVQTNLMAEFGLLAGCCRKTLWLSKPDPKNRNLSNLRTNDESNGIRWKLKKADQENVRKALLFYGHFESFVVLISLICFRQFMH